MGRGMARAVNIDDLRRRARRRLPRMVFDFVDGGAMDERTLAENRGDFEALRFLPRTMVDVGERRQAVRVLGQDLAVPMILAPTGMTGLFGPGGEIAAARAAARIGAGFCLSTMATTTIEDLAAAAPGFWFQLYVQKDRGVTRSFVERAEAAGCPVLCLTVDVVVPGKRERDLRNGFVVPPKFSVANLADFARHPAWLWRMATRPPATFANFAEVHGGRPGLTSVARYVSRQFDRSMTWKDIAWLRSFWSGKIAVKGILSPGDARLAAEHGADAVIVSNHGGRQLDGASSAIAALPAVADAVGDRIEVLMDSGIRRGGDVVKALALGARACLVGRAFLYGLAAGGEAGVDRALEILHGEIDNVQALLGCPDVADLDRSYLADARGPWPGNR